MAKEPEKWNGEPRLIFVEGVDYKYFIIHAVNKNFPDVERKEYFVEKFGGQGDLPKALERLKQETNFTNVQKFLVILDAETRDDKSAKDSLESLLRTNGYFDIRGLSVDCFIIDKECGGTLEELCLKAIFDKSTLIEAENFIDKSKDLFQKENPDHEEGNKFGFIETPHKSKLAAYLAVARKQNKERGGEFATMKLGEAANAGAFDWNHASLEKFLGKLENFLKK